MAFQTIWSVDLGKSALKAVKLRRERNSIEILAIDKVDYPLSENGVDAGDKAKEALGIFRQRNEVRDPVVVSHPGQGTFSRFIKIPAFDQKRVKDMVKFEASQQIPFPLDEVIWDYHIIDREYLPGEEREVGLFAVRKEAIDDYLLEFTQEGLSVEMLSIGYLGLLNFIKYDINPSEPSIVLDIGATHSDLILVDGNRFWIRPLPHSGNDISRSIMSRFKLGFADAERLKLETTKAPQQAEKIFRAVIQPKLQELAQEIQRCIGFYKSQAGDVNFSTVYLLGNGSRIVGIKKFLQDALNVPVEPVRSIGRLRINRDVNVKLLQTDLPAFATALGLGIQAVGAGACQVDLVPKEEKIRKEVQRKRKHVFIAAAAALGCILGAWAILEGKLNRLDETLARVEEEHPARALSTLVGNVNRYRDYSSEGITQKVQMLEGIARDRQGILEALRTIERVTSDFARKEPPLDIVSAGDAAKLQEIKNAHLKKLEERVWIPYLSIDRVLYPEPPAGKKPEDLDVIPVQAYKVTAEVFVRQRESAQASTDAIRTLFIEPVSKDLRLSQWTKDSNIGVQPGDDGQKLLFFQPSTRSAAAGVGAGIGRREDDLAYEAGPFFSQQISWYMVPALPQPKPQEAAAPSAKDGDGGDSDDDRPAKSKRKKKGSSQ